MPPLLQSKRSRRAGSRPVQNGNLFFGAGIKEEKGQCFQHSAAGRQFPGKTLWLEREAGV